MCRSRGGVDRDCFLEKNMLCTEPSDVVGVMEEVLLVTRSLFAAVGQEVLLSKKSTWIFCGLSQMNCCRELERASLPQTRWMRGLTSCTS